jgi:tryptophan 2,3-dioxygenase
MKLSCGHEVVDADQTHYCEYLRLDELLALQPAPGALRHHDELLFIITHQSFELWFKLLLHEIDQAIARLQRDELRYAAWLARRMAAVTRLLAQMMGVLETMSPPDFYEFRDALAPASGTESLQFREVEIASGLRDPHYRKLLEAEADPRPDLLKTRMWTDRLAERWDGASLHSALLEVFARRRVEPADVYRPSDEPNPQAELLALCEALLDYDEAFVMMRFAHARLAERTLGARLRGTGATSGVAFLDAAVQRPRFFPELWDARAEVWERRVRREST